jgi:hypothetical protein
MAGKVRALRVLVEVRSELRRVCKIGFTSKDASLYLHPFGPSGEYFFGRHVIPSGERESTIRFDDRASAHMPPELSIHETGRVHVRFRGRQAHRNGYLRTLPWARSRCRSRARAASEPTQ